jgi:hypothetical protein
VVIRKFLEWLSNRWLPAWPTPKLYSSSCELKCISYFSNCVCVFCRQLQSLEHSVASDVRLILTILQQQHAVHSSESSGSSMMPDYREVRSETPLPLVTPFISLSESLICCYTVWIFMEFRIGVCTKKINSFFVLSAPICRVHNDEIQVIKFSWKKCSLCEILALAWLMGCTRLSTHETWNWIQTNI